MTHPKRFGRLRQRGRTYAAAALLNLALVNTTLTAPERPPAAQTRIVTNARRFRDTEMIALAGGEAGVLSLPLEAGGSGTTFGSN